mmetsp:Transcript_16418/g.24366  ORF Transcript_16418/g.24366 Transcript_16418/m.24366 type:complete len:556 (-) Transcript_16418:58-1725(-)
MRLFSCVCLHLILFLSAVSCTVVTVDSTWDSIRDISTENNAHVEEQAPFSEGERTTEPMGKFGIEDPSIIFDESESDVAYPLAAHSGYLRFLNDKFTTVQEVLSMHAGSFLETTMKTTSELSTRTFIATDKVSREMNNAQTQLFAVFHHFVSNVAEYSSSVSFDVMGSSRIFVDEVTNSITTGSNSVANLSSALFQHGKKASIETRNGFMKLVSIMQSYSSEVKVSAQLRAKDISGNLAGMRERRSSEITGENGIEPIKMNEQSSDDESSFSWFMKAIVFACVAFLALLFVVVKRISTDRSGPRNNRSIDDNNEMLIFEEANKFVAGCFVDEMDDLNNNDSDDSFRSQPEEVVHDDERSTNSYLESNENEDEEVKQANISVELGGDIDQGLNSKGKDDHCGVDSSQPDVCSKQNLNTDFLLLSNEEIITESVIGTNEIYCAQAENIEGGYNCTLAHKTSLIQMDAKQKKSHSQVFKDASLRNLSNGKHAVKPIRCTRRRTWMRIMMVAMVIVSVFLAVYFADKIISFCAGPECHSEDASRKKSYGSTVLGKMGEL